MISNKALYEAAPLDYDVIWLDDYVDELVIPKDRSIISVFTICKVLIDFIQESGKSRVSSRDVGRYLKLLRIGDVNLGDQVKAYGGLRFFLGMVGHMFSIDDSSSNDDPDDNSFWIELQPNAEAELSLEAKQTVFTDAEKHFFDQTYSLQHLEDRNRAYGHTLLLLRQEQHRQDEPMRRQLLHSGRPELPEDLARDYSTCTVAQLKERCRERGLPVSGVKAELLERVELDKKEQIEAFESRSRDSAPLDHGWPPMVPEETIRHLEDLVVEYVKVRGGNANSRDVGRYLAANTSSAGSSREAKTSALQELKSNYGSLANFVQLRPEVLVRTYLPGEDYEDSIQLK